MDIHGTGLDWFYSKPGRLLDQNKFIVGTTSKVIGSDVRLPEDSCPLVNFGFHAEIRGFRWFPFIRSGWLPAVLSGFSCFFLRRFGGLGFHFRKLEALFAGDQNTDATATPERTSWAPSTWRRSARRSSWPRFCRRVAQRALKTTPWKTTRLRGFG